MRGKKEMNFIAFWYCTNLTLSPTTFGLPKQNWNFLRNRFFHHFLPRNLNKNSYTKYKHKWGNVFKIFSTYGRSLSGQKAWTSEYIILGHLNIFLRLQWADTKNNPLKKISGYILGSWQATFQDEIRGSCGCSGSMYAVSTRDNILTEKHQTKPSA